MSITAMVYAMVYFGHAILIFGFVLVERRNPAATLAWVLALVTLPVVGLLAYLLIGRRRTNRRAIASAEVAAAVASELTRHKQVGEATLRPGEPSRTQVMLRLGERSSGLAASANNHCQILVNGAATYRAILEAIDGAEHHAHIQFYIIHDDRTGQEVRDRLVKRQREGVEVRVLVDGVGSFNLPRRFWADLTEAGGTVAVYSPLNPFNRLRRHSRIDFRNHRKVIVVDGRIGFTGGINLGNEYLGGRWGRQRSVRPTLSHWRDTHVAIRGPAVLHLQQSFAEDWLETTGTLLGQSAYYPIAEEAGDTVVQVIPSGPDNAWSPIHRLYTQAISMAQRRVWITNPYFVPDAVMEASIESAALRGVDVRLLLPRRSDHPLVSLASRSYYASLLSAGVRIFEYDRGFVHAKTLVVDDWVGSIGSANMDVRSFELNYELNAFCYGSRFTDELAEQFTTDLRSSRPVSLERVLSLGYPIRLAQGFARLLSPLL